MVTAHTDEELDYLYSYADVEGRFLLDFGLNSGFRDGELSHAEYTDLVGNMLEVKRKPHLGWKPKKHHCRKVTVSQKFADAFRARGKRSETSLVFPNEAGKPNQHLLRDLQALTPNDKPFHTASSTNSAKRGRLVLLMRVCHLTYCRSASDTKT